MSILIQVKNVSTVMTDGILTQTLNAIYHQMAEDVAPFWGTQRLDFELLAQSATFDSKKFQFLVADTSDQAVLLGYHETTTVGEAIGYAFVKTTQEAGMHPSVTISHEIIEMALDPLIDQSCQWSDLPNAIFLAQEGCDPVEDDSLLYMKQGVPVSDFVTPAYFSPTEPGPYDFKKHLTAPNTLATGGYQLVWTPQNGWQQVFAKNHAMGRALLSTPHARRVRRIKKQQGR